MSDTTTPTTRRETTIEAPADVPVIRLSREFDATPAQVMRAHTDPELFARWVGPDSVTTRIVEWDCRTLGSYRYDNLRGHEVYSFRGTFPEVSADRLVQTFCWEAMPEAITLETMTFTALEGGRTRLDSVSISDSFEARDAMLRSGMEVGINEGYRKLDGLLAAGGVPAEDVTAGE